MAVNIKPFKEPDWMPENWTFKSKAVAEHFERHVREQLPWYNLATKAVEHIARHYVPRDGVVYDIGASTGNMGRTLAPLLQERNAKLTSVEESKEMADLWRGPGEIVVADAMAHEFADFDFAVLFLVVMFLPVGKRKDFIMRLRARIKPGGALVIVDKINTPSGYAGTVLRRMAMRWKLDAGAKGEEIVQKELSLAGYQRPVDANWLEPYAVQWFQFGEFSGWLIESSE